MEVDWPVLGCRAVVSWNMRLGSRRRAPLQRSATKTSWADSYTFAKTERPSLDSAPPAAVAETLAAEWAHAAAMEVVSAVTQLLEALVLDDRSMLPTFVPQFPSFPNTWSHSLTRLHSFPTTWAGKT